MIRITTDRGLGPVPERSFPGGVAVGASQSHAGVGISSSHGGGCMRKAHPWVCAIAAALTLGAVGGSSCAAAAEAGRYAPENIEQTYRQLGWLCMVRALCPVTDDVRSVIGRAIAGNPSSEYLLGLTLITGDGLPRDEGAAIAWTVRAVEHGDPDAARDIADRIRNGASIDVEETKIAAALRPKADAGEPEAMRALGPMYIRGRGVKQDPALGLDLLKRAVEKGSFGAANDLSRLYLLGAPGVPASRSEALKWIAVSASRGNADAMVTLGFMSMNTPGGVPSSERNVAQAFCWLMRAALLDSPQAQEQLAMMFGRGERDEHGTVISGRSHTGRSVVQAGGAQPITTIRSPGVDRATDDHRAAWRSQTPGRSMAAAQGRGTQSARACSSGRSDERRSTKLSGDAVMAYFFLAAR